VSDGRLATGFGRPEDSPGFLMWRVTNRWQAAIRAALKPHELTHVQFVLLATLAWLDADGPVTQKRLADAAATDPMMTSQVIRPSDDKRLVTRSAHPDDGRAKALVVTPLGREAADRAVIDVEACDRAFFADAGPEFVTVLRGLSAR
jgi:DNA-binding MarR family transcriptional regulator